ncbi:MAG: hypothetical protein ACRD50_15775 [Candidatus Acidiferrales bacterium]
MAHTLGILTVASSVAGSLGIALALDWLCLRGVMRLMPARTMARSVAVTARLNPLQAISPAKRL